MANLISLFLPPILVSTVPITPVLCPIVFKIDSIKYVVLVLPLVPVTPIIFNFLDGCS